MQAHNINWQQQTLRTTRLIWVIILTTPLLAIIICQSSHAQLATLGSTLPLMGLRTIFYCVAIALFPLIRLYRNRPLIRSSDTSIKLKPQQLSQRFKRRVIVCLIAALLTLLLGLLLCLLGDDLTSFYLLASLSLLSMAIYRPQASDLNELRSEDLIKSES
jgi:Na+/H+ antiporter NhaD/arsenite permease-like protein